jgi:hypothetical protein
VVIGSLGVDGEISNQQTFEVAYSNSDVLRFVGGEDGQTISARIQFHWNGIPADEKDKDAPAFMCIDYLTLHLKW